MPALLVIFLMTGCAAFNAGEAGSPTALPTVMLQPYATRTVFAAPTATQFQTPIPLPSPTPFIYTVQRNDTLGQIAENFGIRLQDLQAANPGVVAESLFVGQQLRIPASSEDAQAIAAPTPAGIQLWPPGCFPSGGGVYCLVLAGNPFGLSVENPIAQVSLVGTDGRPVVSQPAYAPLNIIPPGETLPLVVFFPNQSIDGLNGVTTLQNSTLLLPSDPRYVSISVEQVITLVDVTGTIANLDGVLRLAQDAPVPADTIWLAAVAYAADGSVVGVRRWEWQGSLQPGDTLEFAVEVYSFGPAIAQVKAVVEARPGP